MYCANCGKEIDDKAVVCPYCGVATGKTYTNNKTTENNTIAIVGFIFAFLMPLVGLICSIIGINRSTELNGKGKGLALAGIIISIVAMVAYVIYMIAMIATVVMTA
ncbi:MAG: zinc-ribbon domain-containing protein [Clostridia bacterium]|nr:zinc-ribbon domain-containing protein [Clostridia bacterium]